jgi:hypothetical protein
LRAGAYLAEDEDEDDAVLWNEEVVVGLSGAA